MFHASTLDLTGLFIFQDKAVVGSILNAIGIPNIFEDFKVLETKKLEYNFIKFKVFLIVKYLNNAKISILFISLIKISKILYSNNHILLY